MKEPDLCPKRYASLWKKGRFSFLKGAVLFLKRSGSFPQKGRFFSLKGAVLFPKRGGSFYAGLFSS
jgi:hypothetical protein